MKILRKTVLLLRNTVMVALAVVFGLWAASALSLPLWLWYPCLLPAGYLFQRLSGAPPPHGWKLIGFFSICAVTFFIYVSLISEHIPNNYQTLGLALTAALNLKLIFMSADWLERRGALQALSTAHAPFSGNP